MTWRYDKPRPGLYVSPECADARRVAIPSYQHDTCTTSEREETNVTYQCVCGRFGGVSGGTIPGQDVAAAPKSPYGRVAIIIRAGTGGHKPDYVDFIEVNGLPDDYWPTVASAQGRLA